MNYINARSAVLIASFANRSRNGDLGAAERDALLEEVKGSFDRKVARAMIRLVDGETLGGRTGHEKCAKILMDWCVRPAAPRTRRRAA